MKFSIFNFQFSKGQILVETIIGIGVVGILLSAIIPLFLVGLKAGPEAWKQDIATELNNEQIEAARVISTDNWNNLYKPLGSTNKGADSPYHLQNTDNSWQLVAGEVSSTINNIDFATKIIIENVSRTAANGQGDISQNYISMNDDPATQKVTATTTWPGSSGVGSVQYLTRNKNATWVQQDWSGGGGSTNFPPINRYDLTSNTHGASSVPPNTDINTTVANQIKLAQIPGGNGTPYGNQFLVTGTHGQILNNANYRFSMRFTAQNTGQVDQLRFFVDSQRQANQTTYRYGLQADSGGIPSGVWLSSVTSSSNATGWRSLTLPTPANITAGSVYHFVIQYDSGGPIANRNITIRSSAPMNKLIALTGVTDNSSATLLFNGTAWQPPANQPIYALHYTNNSYEGNPFDTSLTQNLRQKDYFGELFTTGQSELTATGIKIYTALSTLNPPQDSLYVSLIDITAGATLVDNEIVGDGTTITSTTLSWINHNFSSNVILPANHTFRFYFSSPGSKGDNYLVLQVSNTPNTVEYQNLTWQGTTGQASSSANSGGAWSESANRDLSAYLVLNGGLQYAPSGELMSSTFDTGNAQGAGFNRVIYSGTTNGGTIGIQIAVKDTNASWNIASDFAGYDGTSATWFDASHFVVPLSLQGHRYIRYKVRLTSPDGQNTPIVNWIRVNYLP